jgi:NAD(P)-dependent dehydrogenase (short-subunit alcohol dehydrogenase family)
MPDEAPAVLVAGGTGALGGAVLDVLLQGGYRVTASWVMERERDHVQELLGSEEGLTLVEADLMDPGAVEKAVASVDGLAAVVNLVGGFSAPGRVGEVEIDDFDKQLLLNLRPGYLLAHYAMPRLVERGGGSYVGVSTRAALKPFSGAAGYITSKAAVIAFVQALDAEYRGDGIRANAILPSVIDTPRNREDQPDADHSKWVPPAQIAEVVRFLVSDDSTPVSGGSIPVYGRA